MADPAPNHRLGSDVWLQTGIDLLAKEGASALTIDRLCTMVGRSKGSFYHHFQGVDGFVAALLDYWRKKQTEDVIQHVDGESDPRMQRTELMQRAMKLDHGVEHAIRVWGGSDARAHEAVSAVDTQRITYLTAIIAATSKRPKAEAHDLARIEYAALIGLHQLYPDTDPASLTPLFERLVQLVTPDLE
nr:TetR/AcrR family transcriptional regulator [uncultured Cohaesibacter sp.]